MSLTVSLLQPHMHTAWDEYVQNNQYTTPFHSTAWIDVLKNSIPSIEACYLLAESNGTIRGILPLFLCGSFLTGRSLTSLPFAGTQPSVCADDSETEQKLVSTAVELANTKGVNWLEIREDSHKDWGLIEKQSYVNMRLYLADDPEIIWKEKVDSRVRTKVRAAKRRNLHCEFLNDDAEDSFYAIYLDTMYRLGSPPHAKSLFSNVFMKFKDHAHYAVVYDGNHPVAAALVIHNDNWIGFPWAGSLTQARSKHPNNLLYWSIIELACSSGYKYLDLGRSPVNSGTLHFKKQWGAETRSLSYYYSVANNKNPPERDANDSLMRLASNCWRRLPAGLAKIVGPRLASLLP